MESLLSQSYFFLIFWVFFMCCSLCEANYTFYAGGKSGWVLNPSESYVHWAERNRFQVNDTIIFKFKLGSNSVLLVDKDDYNNCNKDNPILELEHGNSKFRFDGSGPFYFISGHEDNCEKGQKLMIVVLSPNHHKAHKAHEALSPAPVESTGPVSPAPASATSGAPGFIGGFFSWSFISSIIAVYFCILV
ncbi:early nodulin-like protein 1 [Solanum dulcamara]|uniref:early nodulin-like protein 1 n=1 Tax=Solanum dulcamara TaxID=45834 RepID=UPI002486B674|nr:early nodulin-like protein 1 [Solanum dulcamara]